jgi:hypothetical protein
MRVEKMYTDLVISENFNEDFCSLKYRYGVDEEFKFSDLDSCFNYHQSITKAAMIDQQTDTNDLNVDIKEESEDPQKQRNRKKGWFLNLWNPQ